MSRVSLGLRRVAARCVGLQVMVRVAAASRAYGRSLRLRASSQAHYGVDEDEE